MHACESYLSSASFMRNCSRSHQPNEINVGFHFQICKLLIFITLLFMNVQLTLRECVREYIPCGMTFDTLRYYLFFSKSNYENRRHSEKRIEININCERNDITKI